FQFPRSQDRDLGHPRMLRSQVAEGLSRSSADWDSHFHNGLNYGFSTPAMLYPKSHLVDCGPGSYTGRTDFETYSPSSIRSTIGALDFDGLLESGVREDALVKVLVVGGDGYCGWATALYLSERGHDVAIADSLIRRHWDQTLGAETLTPIAPIGQRAARWHELTGKSIPVYIGDICDYPFVQQVMREFE